MATSSSAREDAFQQRIVIGRGRARSKAAVIAQLSDAVARIGLVASQHTPKYLAALRAGVERFEVAFES